ncbi:VanZ family protein [Blastococcus xanthinilyticus]|uniref:VanZ like protein n=1 Tax=Blastococcus xanthinilyticus TaxID=1564164 RepID=A0A5S5D1U0_9ACTN|nr:VanZ family protein [Blastococcus xanthinilyticus]TYP89218.1 VanZ like protein [Blastococcus xanthinilyticus]
MTPPAVRLPGRPGARTPGTSSPPSARAALAVLLTAALAAVAAVTLTPEGRGWAWASPAAELRWYATGLDSTATVLQLVGNAGLLVVPAALAVLLWLPLRRPARLTAAALAAGAGIELLQLVLSVGRVVSPLDALLNAGGAVAAGLLVTWGARRGGVHPRA